MNYFFVLPGVKRLCVCSFTYLMEIYSYDSSILVKSLRTYNQAQQDRVRRAIRLRLTTLLEGLESYAWLEGQNELYTSLVDARLELFYLLCNKISL